MTKVESKIICWECKRVPVIDCVGYLDCIQCGDGANFQVMLSQKRRKHIPDELLIYDGTHKRDELFDKSLEQQTKAHWTWNEFPFDMDVPDLQKLNDRERKLFEYILAFFATADGEVLENAVINFQGKSETLAIRMAYTAQAYFETIHVKTYSKALAAYIPDYNRRRELAMSFKTDPLIKERDDWMNDHIGAEVLYRDEDGNTWFLDSPGVEESKEEQLLRIVSFVCAEGLFFMSAFMVIFWFRSRSMFPNFAKSNESISRDEWSHVTLGIDRIREEFEETLSKPGVRDKVQGIVMQAVALETRFATATVPSKSDPERFDGFYLEDLLTHVQNLGNVIMTLLGFKDKQWECDPTKLPPWISWIEIMGKTNFYEGKVTNYTTPQERSEDPKQDVDF